VAKALNYGATQIKSGSKYAMFVHQDVKLLSDSWLEEAERMLDSIPDLESPALSAPENRKIKDPKLSQYRHGVRQT